MSVHFTSMKVGVKYVYSNKVIFFCGLQMQLLVLWSRWRTGPSQPRVNPPVSQLCHHAVHLNTSVPWPALQNQKRANPQSLHSGKKNLSHQRDANDPAHQVGSISEDQDPGAAQRRGGPDQGRVTFSFFFFFSLNK